MKCSIVIRSYNEEKHISRLLTGISHQTIKDLEIILVDSGSTDATIAIARQYPVKIVEINSQEFTFGYSLNRGIAAAHGEFIVISSAHVYPVYPDWLEQLLKQFENPNIALVYGKQLGDINSKFSEQQIFAQWYPDVSQPRQLHPFCNNANAAIRRALWEQHPYDETLTGLEDLDWANWAINQGHFISYNADAEIIHIHDENPRDVYNRYRREAMAFKRIFPDEKFRSQDFIHLVIVNIWTDLLQAFNKRVFISNWISIFWFRFMQFWGTYRGYKQSGLLTEQLRETFYFPRGSRSTENISHTRMKKIDYK